MHTLNRILSRKGDTGRSPARSPSAILEGKGRSTGANSTEEPVDGCNVEGFLCPSCYLAFPTADTLQNHYESTHSDSLANTAVDGRVSICPACKMHLGSEAELQAHYRRHHSNEKEQGEIEALRSQVTALQDGKALVVDELQAVRSQLMELFKENSKIRDERDAFEQKTASLAGELAYLKADFDENKSRKTCLESQLHEAQARIRELEIEIQQRPEADDVSLLKQEIVSVQKMMDQLTLQREAEKDALQRQCSNLQEFINRLQSENAALEDSVKSAPKKDDLKCLQENILQMQCQMAELQVKYDALSSDKAVLQKSLEQYANYDDLQKELLEKEDLLQGTKRLLGTKEELIKKLDAELKTEKENVDRLKEGSEQLFAKIEEGEGASTAILQLKEENVRLQEQCMHEQKHTAQVKQEMEGKLDSLCAELKQAKHDADIQKKKNDELQNALNTIKSQVSAIKKENETCIQQLKDKDLNLSILEDSHKNSLLRLQEELATTKASLNVKLEGLKAAADALREAEKLRFEHTKVETQLKGSLESVKKELDGVKAVWASETSEMKQKIKQLKKENVELLTKCNQEEEKYAHLSKQHVELSSQYEDVVVKLKAVVQQNTDSQAVKDELETKLNQLKEEIKKNHDNEAQLLSTIDDMNEIKKQLSEKVIHCDKQATELQVCIDSLSHEKINLLRQMETINQELSDKKELCAFQENKIAELTECYHDERENRCREVQSLESAKQLLINQKMVLLKDIDSLKEENIKKVACLEERTSSLDSVIQKMEATNKSLTSKLDTAVQSNRRDKEEWEKVQSHLQAQIGVLNENAQTLREDLLAEQSKREALEQKVDELSGSKLELEAKLENALDERRSLLDRCLKRESECEKLQKSTAELRRKLDDTTAALQELGRENQTLQIENTKHLARKWTDDNEVTHCTTCGKLFTVTVRKHHCRNCGNIFCNECSSRTAAIASSKKPVRVCDLCYAEVSK